MKLDQNRLRELFTYDPNEPLALRWRHPPKRASRIKPGDIAGSWHTISGKTKDINRFVTVDSHRVAAARVVWVYHYGTQPPPRLGFKNGDFRDIRLENLTEIFNKIKTMGGILRYTAAYNLKNNHGMTYEEYEKQNLLQNGLCAICKEPEKLIRNGKTDRLSVDHCHRSGQRRALLCNNCNNGLGRFKDSPERLRQAAIYLENFL